MNTRLNQINDEKNKISRIKNVFDCQYCLMFEERVSSDHTVKQLVSHTVYTKKEAEQFLLLLKTLSGAGSHLLFITESRQHKDLYRVVIKIEKMKNAEINAMERHKIKQFKKVADFLNQLNFPNEKIGEWKANNHGVAFEAYDSEYLSNTTEMKIEKGIKKALKHYCALPGIQFNLRNNLPPLQYNIFTTTYALSNGNASFNDYYPLPLSPLYLLLLKVIPHVMTSDLNITEELNLETILGRGHFATVYSTYYHNEEVAIKMSESSQPFSYESLRREEMIFKLLAQSKLTLGNHYSSDNIITFYGVQKRNEIGLLVEMATAGSLDELLYDESRAFSLIHGYHVARGIANGLDFLHQSGIVYCDLKPENILLMGNGEIKLADFGLSKTKSEKRKNCGTPFYCAPEVLADVKQDAKSDIFSQGITFWTLLTRQEVRYEDATDMSDLIKAVVEDEKRPSIPDFCPTKVANFIKMCWAANPSDRPTASESVQLLNSLKEADLADTEETNKSLTKTTRM